MRRSFIAVAAVLATLIVPSTAAASFLVYQCGYNLCRVNPDGSGQSQLTSDGTSSVPYRSPSLSTDGTHLAFIAGGALSTSDASAQHRTLVASGSAVEAHMAPDGSRVMGVMDSGYGSNQIITWNLSGSGKTDDWYPDLSGGYGASGTEEIGNTQKSPTVHVIVPSSLCLLTNTPPSNTCARVVAQSPNSSAYLYLPTLQPGGSTLAVEEASSITGPTTISTYNYSTGAFIANLTNGTTDRSPTWSPDGKSVAFQRGTQIYKVPVTGGAAQLIVANGTQPTWGGPPDTTGVSCHVPNLKGKTRSQAKSALQKSHCALGKVRTAKSRHVRKGHVISQSVRAGRNLKAGSKVNIVLAR